MGQQENKMSKLTHNAQEEHIKAGEFVKSAVYGGLDGIITSLSIALSGIGSSATAGVIVALGLSSLIADALSMAVADYLATKTDDEFMKAEQKRERIQMENDFEAQKLEMIHIYKNMGLQNDVAHEIVDILSQNKEGFLKVMMIEELHLIPDEENPIRNSIVTFFSFCIFGIMPLIPFFVAQANNIQLTDVFTGTTIGIAAFFLFVLGFGKSFVTSQKWYFSTLETILIGAISAGAAFGIGKAFGE